MISFMTLGQLVPSRPAVHDGRFPTQQRPHTSAAIRVGVQPDLCKVADVCEQRQRFVGG